MQTSTLKPGKWSVSAACAGVARQLLDPLVMDRARTVGPANLRSLDAIHVVSATRSEAKTLITYDDRMATAARAAHLRVVEP